MEYSTIAAGEDDNVVLFNILPYELGVTTPTTPDHWVLWFHQF